MARQRRIVTGPFEVADPRRPFKVVVKEGESVAQVSFYREDDADDFAEQMRKPPSRRRKARTR